MAGAVPLSTAALEALARGLTRAPSVGSLVYREAKWSYRRPISYDVCDVTGHPIARIEPVDRSTAVFRVGDRPLLTFSVDRRGNTAVSDAVGTALGGLRRRRALLSYTMELRWGDAVVGALEQAALSTRPTVVRWTGGAPAAWIHRSGGRFAGADVSRLDLLPAAAAIPGPLLLAAVPALDAYRRAARAATRP
jgi:hypothetical protein